MRVVVLVTLLGLVALTVAASSGGDDEQGATDGEQSALSRASGSARPRRWIVFRPMFATRARQRALNRASARHDLRRQSRQRDRRPKRALHFPAGGAGAVEESGLALRVAVNDLLFQSAPANDLPDPSTRVGGVAGGAGAAGAPLSGPGGSVAGGALGSGGLRPMLLARLRAASREREPAAEEEAFLLMSAAGGPPAIVPAPTSRPVRPQPALPPRPRKQALKQHAKHHKQRKGGKHRARRAAPAAPTRLDAKLGAQLDAKLAAMADDVDGISERVKKYDAVGAYPTYSYTHGRFTRAATLAAAAAPTKDVQVMKVKVHGVDDDDDDESMDAAETVVFRPLFVHRDREAAKLDAKRRRAGFVKKPVKPAAKPLRRRQPQPALPAQPTRPLAVAVPVVPVRRPPAAAAYFHRRTFIKHPPRHRPTTYRRIVYYH